MREQKQHISLPGVSIETLYDRYAAVLLSHCRRVMRSTVEAEDALQDTFVKVHRALKTDTPKASYSAWLHRIATNVCIDRLRSKYWQSVDLDDSCLEVLSDSIDIGEQVASREILSQMSKLLDRRSMEIVVQHYIAGMDQGQVAASLGISRRAVAKRLKKIRESFPGTRPRSKIVPDCPSRFSLVKWHTQELDAFEADKIAAHVSGCISCGRVVDEFRLLDVECADSKSVFLQQVHTRVSTGKSASTSGSTWYKSRPFRWASGLGVAAATTLIVLSTGGMSPEKSAPSSLSDIRFKGSVAMRILAKRNQWAFVVEPGASLRPGDQLTFKVTTDDKGYVGVFLIPKGAPSKQIVPKNTLDVMTWETLSSGGNHRLGSSYLVDIQSKDAIILCAFAKQPFDFPAVYDVVRNKLEQLSQTDTVGASDKNSLVVFDWVHVSVADELVEL